MLHRACNRANWYPVGDLRSAIMAGQQRWLERQTDLTSSYARRRPALPEGLEWRVEGLVAAGRTADVKPGRSVPGAESAGCLRPGSDNALYMRLTDAWP